MSDTPSVDIRVVAMQQEDSNHGMGLFDTTTYGGTANYIMRQYYNYLPGARRQP